MEVFDPASTRRYLMERVIPPFYIFLRIVYISAVQKKASSIARLVLDDGLNPEAV
jgi:hypothetical protein